MNKEKQQLLINSLIFAVKVFDAAKSADVALWHFQDSEKLENLPDEITKLFESIINIIRKVFNIHKTNE